LTDDKLFSEYLLFSSICFGALQADLIPICFPFSSKIGSLSCIISMDGFDDKLGCNDGFIDILGVVDGIDDGIDDGCDDGCRDGVEVGFDDGCDDGLDVGFDVGLEEGRDVGEEDGREVG
jgi:hypothetical protein